MPPRLSYEIQRENCANNKGLRAAKESKCEHACPLGARQCCRTSFELSQAVTCKRGLHLYLQGKSMFEVRWCPQKDTNMLCNWTSSTGWTFLCCRKVRGSKARCQISSANAHVEKGISSSSSDKHKLSFNAANCGLAASIAADISPDSAAHSAHNKDGCQISCWPPKHPTDAPWGGNIMSIICSSECLLH